MSNRVFNNYRSNRAALYLAAGHTATPPGHEPESGVKAQSDHRGNIFGMSNGILQKERPKAGKCG